MPDQLSDPTFEVPHVSGTRHVPKVMQLGQHTATPASPEQAVLERVPRDRISMLPGPPALFQTILGRSDLDARSFAEVR